MLNDSDLAGCVDIPFNCVNFYADNTHITGYTGGEHVVNMYVNSTHLAEHIIIPGKCMHFSANDTNITSFTVAHRSSIRAIYLSNTNLRGDIDIPVFCVIFHADNTNVRRIYGGNVVSDLCISINELDPYNMYMNDYIYAILNRRYGYKRFVYAFTPTTINIPTAEDYETNSETTKYVCVKRINIEYDITSTGSSDIFYTATSSDMSEASDTSEAAEASDTHESGHNRRTCAVQ